jgi:hypothetical protein
VETLELEVVVSVEGGGEEVSDVVVTTVEEDVETLEVVVVLLVVAEEVVAIEVLEVVEVVVEIGLLQSSLNKSAVRSVQLRGITGDPWQESEYTGKLLVLAISSSTMRRFTSSSHTVAGTSSLMVNPPS